MFGLDISGYDLPTMTYSDVDQMFVDLGIDMDNLDESSVDLSAIPVAPEEIAEILAAAQMMGIDLSAYDVDNLTYGDVETIFAAAGLSTRQSARAVAGDDATVEDDVDFVLYEAFETYAELFGLYA